jgi:hypothetical protein
MMGGMPPVLSQDQKKAALMTAAQFAVFITKK